MPLGAVTPRKSGPPEAVQDGGCRRRRLLAQRRACCPGLSRGLVQVPATRAPPSAAPAPRAIELAVHAGCLLLDFESFEGFGCCFYVIFECACDSSVFFVLCLIASKAIWAIFMAFLRSKLI